MIDSSSFRDTLLILHTHLGKGLFFTIGFSSLKVKHLLSISSCTLALELLESSVECPTIPAYYSHLTFGLYHFEIRDTNSLNGLGTTNSFWTKCDNN